MGEEQLLTSLGRGVTATVTGFLPGDEEAVRKILSLGIAPGDEVRILSTWPATVLELGATSYALDRELAGRILVQAEAG